MRATATPIDYEAANRTLLRGSTEVLSAQDLLAEIDEREVTLCLLLGDKAAKDYSWLPEPILDSAIAFEAEGLNDATSQLERLNRAKRLADFTGIDAATAFAPRWEAVRALDLIDALHTLGVPLVQRRDEWWACCPLHEEKTPSFSANRVKQVWHCFSCGLGGDLIDFIAHRQHLSKVEALRFAELVLLDGVIA